MSNEIELKRNKYEMLKCIWMTSGIIDYKLCDNRFDCENCMFDKVMRNLMNKNDEKVNTVNNVFDIISEKLRSIKYDDKIIYLKNNLIAKEICPNTFYLGIDPILSCFLDSSCSLTLIDSEKNILIRQNIIRISGMWGAVDLSSPMNFKIYEKVSDPADNFLMSKWHAIIGLENREIFRGRLSSEEWDNMYEKAICFVEEIKLEEPEVGTTMMDGGAQIKYLHQLIGNKKYIIILNSLIT